MAVLYGGRLNEKGWPGDAGRVMSGEIYGALNRIRCPLFRTN